MATVEMNDVNKKLKVAFLGGGIDSAVGLTHRIAAEMDKRFELVAGCFSRYPDINRRSADKYDVASNRTYDGLHNLVMNEKDHLDAIIILTPTPDHKDNIIQCVESGIPVVCEKAMAASVKECIEIEKIMRMANGFLTVTYNYTGYPMLRELRNFISQGKLGKLNLIQIEMPQEGFIKVDKFGHPQKPQEWRLHDGDIPTMSLDLGVHLHHIIDFLTNEKPVELVATQHHFGLFKQIIDNVVCIANYTNDLGCNIWYSKAALGHRNGLRVRVYGQKGSAEWFQMNPEIMYFHDHLGCRTVIDRASPSVNIALKHRYNRFKVGHPAGYIEAFANQYWDIADSLLEYLKTGLFKPSKYVFDWNSAKEGLIFLDAIKKSSANRKWISFNDQNESK
jgi:predicted dehydrogenase